MLSVANRPSKHFMSDCGPLLKHVWACLAASSSPLARHFLDFWQPWIKRPWRRCERSFKQIWWREPPFASVGGLWDRFDQQYVVVDVDGTKQAARQRALPHLPSLPSPHRRFDLVAAPGYKGRKRGEVVRTRTTLLQAHTHQF